LLQKCLEVLSLRSPQGRSRDADNVSHQDIS
jgi:hypothetical protein